MAKVKEFIKNLSPRQIALSVTVVISLLLFVLLTVWCRGRINGLSDQQAAKRWDKEGASAQVSCFFDSSASVDEFQIKSFEKQLESALSEAAVTGEKEEARLYIDAYSARGKVTLVSGQASLEAKAVGIGGDFFQFHPLTLVSGGYFSGNDLMKDSVILDEEAAWQLFGSNDIVGMSVTIGNVPHYIAGVVKRESGHFAENAGLKNTVVYVSNETLENYGTSEGISVYEVVAPNPVKRFVYNTVKEKFGLEEEEMTVVENSSRYSVESMISVVLDFGVRSMQNTAVQYPYWENIARGYEDVRAVVLLLQLLLLMIPSVIIIVFLIIKWKNRSFTGKDVIRYLTDKKDRAIERARAQKEKWHDF